MMFRVACLVAAVGCSVNQSGNTSSTKNGDLSNAAEHGSALGALTAACGDGAPTSAGTSALKREPYLQQVTTRSAMVGLVTAATTPGVRVVLTRPDGTPVTEVRAEIEDGELRVPGQKQLWTTLDGLEPSTTYCYAIHDSEEPLTARAGFVTAPTADDPAPIRFLAFGDSGGGGADQYALAEQMQSFPYGLIVHTGDIAYDKGTLQQFEDNVFGVYQDLLRSIPFWPIAGNHEYETANAAAYRDVFALPGDSGEQWYSFDWGRIHFSALDTERDFATQVAWLDRDLEANKLPWKIVFLHRPPYSSGHHGSDVTLRNLLAPIVEKHGVHLVLAGHDHHYERMKPQGGVNYVVTGGGGKGTRDAGTSSFTAFTDEVIHYVYVEVELDKLVLHAIDGTGGEFDSLVIQR
jgi:hypothetical protein